MSLTAPLRELLGKATPDERLSEGIEHTFRNLAEPLLDVVDAAQRVVESEQPHLREALAAELAALSSALDREGLEG